MKSIFSTRQPRLFLIFTLIVGSFFRFYHLGYESLWLDEGYSVVLARQSAAQIIGGLSGDLHPPLYGLLLHGWVLVFGDSEAALRSLSVFFGILTLLAAYFLARRLFGERTARYTALIISLSTFHVFYSQEARSYTLMAFLATLSFYFFVRLLDEKNRLFSAGYFFSTILLLYTHNFGLLTLAGQNLLYFGWKFLRHKSFGTGIGVWAGLQALLFLLWAPWIYISVNQAGSIGSESWIARPTLHTILEALRFYAGGYRLLLFYLAALLLATRDILKNREFFSGLTLFLWAATVFLTPLAVSLVWTPVFIPRYMIAGTVPLILLAARGLAGISSTAARRAFLVVLAALCLNSLYLADHRIDKEEWRGAMAYLDSHALAGDLVVVNSAGTPVIDYYLKRKDLNIRVFPAAADRTAMLFDWAGSQVSEKNVHEIADMAAGRDRVWLLRSHYFGNEKLVDVTLKGLYGPSIFYQEYQGIILSLYESRRG